MPTLSDKILRRIWTKKRGWVFSPKDFLDIASRSAVDNIVSRLTKRGLIHRIDKGVYIYPKHHPAIGILSPDLNDLIKMITRKTGDKVFPSGAMAANLLGLSAQVPAKAMFLTNGPSRNKIIANRTIVFKHARVPLLDQLSFEANLTLQALKYLGKNHIDDHIIEICASKLSKKDILSLNKAVPMVPAWMAHTIYKLQHIANG